MTSNFSDPIGQACLDYLETEDADLSILVEAVGFEDDVIPVPYLFRTFQEMPPVEKAALRLCRGSVLDVGAGVGCHSHYLKKEGFDVEALEISSGAITILQKLNITTIATDINDFHAEKKYDTVLVLMNGIGLSETIEQLPYFLLHLTELLKPGGQLLCDSTDLSYLYEGLDEEDLEEESKGEIIYRMSYKNHRSDWFTWLYINFEKLSEICVTLGLQTQLIFEGDNNEYLIQITKNEK